MAESDEGRRVVIVSLGVLGVTAALQLAVVLVSGSVGLLADMIHNGADALTAIPLWIAFSLGRRPPNRRYTYGYGRAEDAAGLAIVGIIFVSAAVALWESLQKFVHPQAMENLPIVAIGALVGFGGNELVAWLRTSAGKRIGSAALVADGQHARADAITSLSVLLAVLGSWLGFPLADPAIGLLITFAILLIGKDAGLMMWRRLMDAVEPELLETAEHAIASVSGVMRVDQIRGRWVGHRIIVDVLIVVDETLSVAQGHRIAEDAKHALLHAVPRLADATVHVDPCEHSGVSAHGRAAHHVKTETSRLDVQSADTTT
jgi:cation diffusion facilitator family transporter